MNNLAMGLCNLDVLEEENYISLVRRDAIYLPLDDKFYGNLVTEETENPDKKEKEMRNTSILVPFLVNISSLGLTLSEDAIKELLKIDYNVLEVYLPSLITAMRKYRGDDVKYIPFYKNFPEEVLSMSESELYITRIFHYISHGVPVKEEYEGFEDRKHPDVDYSKLKKINIITKSGDFQSIISNLVSSKTSISDQDKGDIEFYIKHHPSIIVSLSKEEIPMKENLAFFTSLVMKYVEMTSPFYSATMENLLNNISTATDVLRFYVAISGGDISLKNPTKFISLKRKEQRFMMDLLSHFTYKNMREDMKKYKEEWKQAGKRIKPNAFRDPKYDTVRQVFFEIRNDIPISTFEGRLKKFIEEEKWTDAVLLLKSRPGIYARNLDLVLRKSNDPDFVIQKFMEISNELPSRILLQLIAHFKGRDKNDFRVFLPKGQEAHVYNIPNNLEPIDEKYKKFIIQHCENILKIKLSQGKDFLGNVYVSEEFKNFMIPTSQRSATSATRMCTRGSRFKLKEDTESIRSFIWWTNTKDGNIIDIDLSASFFDEDLKFTETIAYFNQRLNEAESSGFIAVSSGDFVNGGPYNGDGVAEFIDIEFPKDGYDPSKRYIVIQVNLYEGAGYKLSELNARAGYMERTERINTKLIDDVKDYYEFTRYYNDSINYHYNISMVKTLMEKRIKEQYNDDSESAKESINKMRLAIFNPAEVEAKFNLSGDRLSVPFIIDTKEREIIWADLETRITKSQEGNNNTLTTLDRTQAILYSVLNMNQMSLYDLILLNVKARGVLVDNKEEADVIFDMNEGITPFQLDIFMSEYM